MALKEAVRHGNDEHSKADRREQERLQEDVHRLDRQVAEATLAKDAAHKSASELGDALKAKAEEVATLGRSLTKAESEAALAQAQLATRDEQVGAGSIAYLWVKSQIPSTLFRFSDMHQRRDLAISLNLEI